MEGIPRPWIHRVVSAILAVALAAWSGPAGAVGYDIANISNNSFTNGAPQINNRGQLVWCGAGGADDTAEIYYYDTRVTGETPHRLTNNSFTDDAPRINDNGQIVWWGFGGAGGTGEIYYYDTRVADATPHQLTNNSYADYNPQINDQGEIVWYGAGAAGAPEIYYYDTRVTGETPQQLTENSFGDDDPRINDSSQIVWQGAGGAAGTTEIYFYDARVAGGTPQQLTNNSFGDYYPRINDQGQIVWQGSGSADGTTEIYYYDTRVEGETPHRLTNNSFYDYDPQINDLGQVVWYENGAIWYYDTRVADETPHQLTNDSFSDYDPQINDNGLIVWQGSGGSAEIYYYDTRVAGETPHQLTNNSFPDNYSQVNDRGQIAWSGNAQIYLAAPAVPITYSRYAFTYHYGNGDYYTGSVYAPTSYHGYHAGYTQTATDENGETGYYEITDATDLGSDDSQAGQVYVTGYYDRESGNTYTPMSNGASVGASYLTSEHDYILKSGVLEYYFGGGFFEADLTTYAYAFKFTYGSGDYYTGTVYAAPEYVYSTSYTKTTTDENGNTDTYTITGMTSGMEVSQAGQVYVTSYYDSESGTTYTPVSSGSAVGTIYLGSEHDYIIQSGIADFYFGGGYYEADTGAYSRYNFYYWYSDGSGDCYAGYVYAPTGWFTAGTYLYYQPLPMGGAALEGCYYITSATAGYTSAYDKQSYITTYYDYHNSAWTACGVNQDGSTTAGSIYLADRSQANETGYAIYSSSAKYFDISTSAAFTYAASMPAASQAVWAAYWSQAPGLLDEGS